MGGTGGGYEATEPPVAEHLDATEKCRRGKRSMQALLKQFVWPERNRVWQYSTANVAHGHALPSAYTTFAKLSSLKEFVWPTHEGVIFWEHQAARERN